jgi:hypothetical protein
MMLDAHGVMVERRWALVNVKIDTVGSASSVATAAVGAKYSVHMWTNRAALVV